MENQLWSPTPNPHTVLEPSDPLSGEYIPAAALRREHQVCKEGRPPFWAASRFLHVQLAGGRQGEKIGSFLCICGRSGESWWSGVWALRKLSLGTCRRPQD